MKHTKIFLMIALFLTISFVPVSQTRAAGPAQKEVEEVELNPSLTGGETEQLTPTGEGGEEVGAGGPVKGGNPELSATDEKGLSTPTGWWWYYGQTAAQLQTFVNNPGTYRIVDVEVEQYSPDYRFSVAVVKNTGSYAKGWWFYYGLTSAQVSSQLSSKSARLIDLEVYNTGSGLRFAVVMVPNTGSEAKAWWWYFGQSVSGLSSKLSANGARLIDVETYLVNGTRYYAGVMIKNTGVDASAWWWYVNATPAQISEKLSTNNARLISIESVDAAAGTFNVIMTKCPCAYWWWYYGVDASTLIKLYNQNGARIVDIETYSVGGQRRFAVVMNNNSNALTTRVGQLLRSNTDGTSGLYLKQVGGATLASLNAGFAFEPASTIKVVPHLYAMRQVQAGNITLTTNINRYADIADTSCPGGDTGMDDTLNTALGEMMKNSDNERTKGVVEHFGVSNINAMATSIGMTSTSINHTIGCGGPTPNRLSLNDAGKLYEGVANGTLLSATYRPTFWSLMAGKGYDFTGIWSKLVTMVDQVAPATLTTAEKTAFKNQFKLSYKAGGYTLSGGNPWLEYRSVAGWAQVPFCSSGRVAPRQYVFGIFIDGSSTAAQANAAFDATKAELFREQIRAALAGWAACA